MAHGNHTENTSFMDVIFALKQNIFKTLNTCDLYVVRQLGDKLMCESLTNSDTKIEAIKLRELDVQVDDIVLVMFTAQDFRASLNAYKNNNANTNSETTEFHKKTYGIIAGVVYRKGE